MVQHPRRTLGVFNAEEGSHIDEVGALSANLEREVWVDLTAVIRLGAIDRSLDFDSDVEGFCKSAMRL